MQTISESSMEAEISCLPETSIGNLGLRKRVVQKGNSWLTPFPGDEVEVQYSVKMKDGEYFDSSGFKESPFRFKLGHGEVIKCLDEGIATMKKGERAMFTVPPDLAYGDVGSPPMIPPNATLVFEIEMLSWNSIRDINGDGGILKKIIKEGEGWATPKDAYEVLDCYLCPAMSRAVKTMRRGEKAELSVKFHDDCFRFFGDDHYANDILPTNSKLNIQLELLSWKSVIDVMGDKKILKRITTMGEGFDHPNEGSLAKVIYVGKLEDGTIFESEGSLDKPFEYVCLEEQINEGLDRAVITMRKGEEATVSVSSEFYHGTEIGRLLCADSVHYEIKLISFVEEKPHWKMDTEEKLEACRRKKDGNELFKAGRFQLASKKYEKERNFHFDIRRNLYSSLHFLRH